jgi:hypothetical protein
MMELLLSIPDAIGRTLLLTRFSVIPLLHPVNPRCLPATPSTFLLVPFILAVPFAALIFTGTNFFAPAVALTTPSELRPWGWTALDAWIPIALPTLFLFLIGPVPGWPWGFGTHLSEDAGIVVCAVVASVCFLSRTWWNLAPKRTTAKKIPRKAKKVKKA